MPGAFLRHLRGTVILLDEMARHLASVSLVCPVSATKVDSPASGCVSSSEDKGSYILLIPRTQQRVWSLEATDSYTFLFSAYDFMGHEKRLKGKQSD